MTLTHDHLSDGTCGWQRDVHKGINIDIVVSLIDNFFMLMDPPFLGDRYPAEDKGNPYVIREWTRAHLNPRTAPRERTASP